jgi:hypothetical protein
VAIGWVDLSTNWIGRPCEPGSAGGRNATTRWLICLRDLLHDGLHLVTEHLPLLQCRIGCGGRQQNDDALVLLRCEFAAGAAVQEVNAADHQRGEQQCHRQRSQAAAQAAFVPALQATEASINEPGQSVRPAARLALSVRFQQVAAHHRRQGQRDNRRHRHRTDDGEGEFGEQGARQATLEADRHVDRDQHDGHRDDRVCQVARGSDRGVAWPHAFLQVAVDAFDHDDGVVDDQSDRQHEGEQGQQVDGKAQHKHDREGANQRQRNGDHGNNDGTGRSQKGEHHEGDDQDCFGQRPFHLGDGAVHEHSGIIDHVARQAAGQLLLDQRQHGLHARDDREQAGRGNRLDADIDALSAVVFDA